MANILDVPQNYSNTLNVAGGIDDSQTTGIVLTSVANLPTDGGILCIDWSASLDTDVAEYIEYTGISGNTLTGVTRGAEGIAAKAHSNGAVVAGILSRQHIKRLKDNFTAEHDRGDGTHTDITATSLSTDTITEKTSDSGVTVDSALIKDGGIKILSTQTTYKFKAFISDITAAKASGSIVTYDSEVYDPASVYDNSTYVFTAPVAGDYLSICRLYIISPADQVGYGLRLDKNTSTTVDSSQVTSSGTQYLTVQLESVVTLAEGDTLNVDFIATTGTKAWFGSATGEYSHWAVRLLP